MMLSLGNITKFSFIFILSVIVQAGNATAQNGFAYPVDSGTLNVKDFGAVGDGVHDDTQAFAAALAATSDPIEYWHVRIVYVPEGTYLVSDTITKRNPLGNYDAGFVLIGAGRGRTI